MKEFFLDDKNMVILAVLILGLSVIFSGKLDVEAAKIINGSIVGLFGIAVGRATK
jgi:hypothetical protein